MKEYKITNEKDLKEIAYKVIDLFESENISPLDSLYITKQLQNAIIEAFKKEGEEIGK